jgi:MYXO-CTERM domain-containing protein
MSDIRQTPEQIEADIERQRDELAATVTQLHARLDVKARARHKVNELKDRATTDTGGPRPDVAAVAVLAVVALVGLVVWRARR